MYEYKEKNNFYVVALRKYFNGYVPETVILFESNLPSKQNPTWITSPTNGRTSNPNKFFIK